MADLNKRRKITGREVILLVADGSPNTPPTQSSWKALGALTEKSMDFSPNMISSNADDSLGYVEQYVTQSEFTISVSGEVRAEDALDEYGIINLLMKYNNSVKARQQPSMWVKIIFGSAAIEMWGTINAFSTSGGTNDLYTFDTGFSVGDSTTVATYKVDEEGLPI